MKPNRGAGPDGIFSEGLQLTAKESTDLVCALWETCGRLNYTPAQFREAIIVPIHKAGETGTPGNYRPISLISHLRKIIDKALDIRIREEYAFHRFQVGFRSRMGTETAILRAEDSLKSGFKYVACLDLKAAYDSVPRRKLQRRLRRVLSKNLFEMVCHTLNPTTISTQGDITQTEAVLTAGVQQGSPASPALFNIFIDDLAHDIERLAGFNVERAAIFYADDVLLLARNEWELQRLLDIATHWATQNGMTWSTRKSHVMVPLGHTGKFVLAGVPLQRVDEITYLGVTLNRDGITATKLRQRIQAAQARWSSVLRLEKRLGDIPTETAVTFFKTVVRPAAEYGLHLCPVTTATIEEYEALEGRVIRKAVGALVPKDRPRARKLLRLLSFSERRCTLISKILDRAESTAAGCSETPHSMEAKLRSENLHIIKKWYTRQGRPPRTTSDTVHRSWRIMCAHYKRPIPNPRTGPIPAITLRHAATRRRALRYYFTKFPTGRTSAINERLRASDEAHAYEVVRSHLSKPTLTLREKSELEKCIRATMAAENPPNQAVYSNETRETARCNEAVPTNMCT